MDNRMNVRDLIELLEQFDQSLQVEIATEMFNESWYGIYDLEVAINYEGNTVLVINTN